MDLREYIERPHEGHIFVESFSLMLPRKRRGPSSGYPVSRFTETPLSEFICGQCSEVVKRPVECTQCGVLTCFHCAFPEQGIIRRSGEVPCTSCQKPTSHREISRVLKRMIGDLKIKCKYPGCDSVLTLETLKTHEKQCDLKIVKCANFSKCSMEGFLLSLIHI